MSDELKACPFCGSANIAKPIGEIGWQCRQCGSIGYGHWNTRPIEDALRKQLDIAIEAINRYVERGGWQAEVGVIALAEIEKVGNG